MRHSRPPYAALEIYARSESTTGPTLNEIRLGHRLGAGRDRLNDVLVTRAAAQIAFEFFANHMVREVVTLAVNHVDRGHDHARGTEAALQAVMLAERLLHR